MTNVPDDLRYTKDHEWARFDDGTVRVGITDYAQDALGDVVFVQMAEVGATVAAGASLGEVESTKSVSDIYAPVGGTISAVNPALRDDPDRINADPYGEGWICEIQPADEAQRSALADEYSALLDAEAYRRLIS